MADAVYCLVTCVVACMMNIKNLVRCHRGRFEIIITERHGLLHNTLASHSGGSGLKYRPGGRFPNMLS
jgi:hypothetical protein